MNEEKREILEHLVEYLQDKIDTGYHKIFYNDDMYDEKTIDCINAINDTLEENKRLNKENEELKKIQCTFLGTGCKAEIERLNNIINGLEKWLDTIPNYFMDSRSNNNGVYIQKGMKQQIDMTKTKIKELKGSNENG